MLAITLCSGLLTGFQTLDNPAIPNPPSSQPLQSATDTDSLSEQAASNPADHDTQTPPQTPADQPAKLTKPQPLAALPPAHIDLSTALDDLVTKQTTKMNPYIPLIQEITIGLEQISLAKNLWYGLKHLKKKDAGPPYEWAGIVRILWKGNMQLVGNLGHVSLYPSKLQSNTHAYQTNGFYGGLGIGYTSHYNPTNNLYAGLHYNRAHFTNHTLSTNPHTQVISKKLTASWLEVVVGTETRLFEKVAFYGGCTLHLGWLYHYTSFDPAKNYVIPGYGICANKLNIGLNLYILYKFSFIERMIKLT
jgi:hypothetical protein